MLSKNLTKAFKARTPRFFHTSLNKVVGSYEEALAGLKPGDKILVGGSGICGIPENLLRYIASNEQYKDFWAVSCSAGIGNDGLGLLIKNKKIKRLTTSYAADNPECERQYLNGDLAIEFCPLGNLSERIRSGAVGVRAFYTTAGANTYVETGGFPVKYGPGGKGVVEYTRQKEDFNNKKCILEEWIRGDFSLIKAWKADTYGNLMMRGTARNVNPDMAGAAKITVAEVEEIVPAGSIDGDLIHVPGIFIDRVVKGQTFERKIAKHVYNTEKGIVYKEGHLESWPPEEKALREKIAKRAALELSDGMYVNFGFGIPSMIHGFLPETLKINIMGENGILGVGMYPEPGKEDSEILNAGNETTTALPEASFFGSSMSHGIFRGGHLSAFFLGGLQVSSKGDLSNWVVTNKKLGGLGAMDSVATGAKIIVCMTHLHRNKSPKILERCTLPLSGANVVHMLITDYAVFTFQNEQMILKEVAHDHTLEEVINKTGCDFIIPSSVETY